MGLTPPRANPIEPGPSRAGALARFEAFLATRAAWVTAILFVAALLPRVYVATRWAHEPVWDGQYYHTGAQSIAEGHGYAGKSVTDHGVEWHPWCHYPVGYSAFLAFFYRLFGARPLIGTLAGALVGGLTVVVVHRLALARMSHVRALAAGFLCAAHPGLILYAGLLMTEPLAALGIVLAPLSYLKLAEGGARERPLRGALLAGVVLGLTTLVRPQSILGAPLIGLFARARDGAGGWRRALIVAVFATASCVAVVIPWTVRNCRVMDGCAFVSTNGGWNLAIGSSPHATGRFDAISGADGCREVTGQVQQDRCWFDQGATWIRADPWRWIALAPKKLAFTFDHQSFPVGYLSQADPSAWPEERRALYRRFLSFAQYILLGIAALGVVPRPRAGRFDVWAWAPLLIFCGLFLNGIAAEPPTVWLVAMGIAVVGAARTLGPDRVDLVAYLSWTLGALIVIHAVFFGEDRYQIVITPALTLLAAAAMSKRSSERGASQPKPIPDRAT